jgi:membrane protein YqaA with SNARE-associated domain
MDADASLWTLFASSFLAATLLPGGSEAVLFAVLKMHPDSAWSAVAWATVGNTLGGMSSYLVGRLIPQTKPLKGLGLLQRFGSPLLLFSWVPLIGDALCVAAGWLRLNPALAAVYMAVGKCARYALIAAAVL